MLESSSSSIGPFCPAAGCPKSFLPRQAGELLDVGVEGERKKEEVDFRQNKNTGFFARGTSEKKKSEPAHTEPSTAIMQASVRSSSIVAQAPNEVLALEQTLIRRARRKVRQSNLRTRFERAFEAIFMHQSLDCVVPRQERILEAQLSKLDTHGHWRQRR